MQLQYNLPVWNPYFKKDVFIKIYPKKFSHYVFICCNIPVPFTSYADRLHKFGINSLEYHRLEFDAILMFKI